MKLYLVRHGETELNRKKLMQGLTDEPLNATGREQAEGAHEKLKGVHFDAVISSPLSRAVNTASIISGVSPDDIIKDERITEVCFGDYELRPYTRLGPKMTMHWLLPDVFPAPKTVETPAHIKERAEAFLAWLKTTDYDTVLVVSHGNLIRNMIRVIEGGHGMVTPKNYIGNCEVREFDL